jgi:hypothetical protein
MEYIPKYKTAVEKLQQQFISGQITGTTVKQYPDWVRNRAGNEFLEELRGDLKLPTACADSEKQKHAFATA